MSHSHSISDVTGLQSAIDAKQDALSSGVNIKTLNSISLLGSGNITIGSPLDGGSASSVYGGSNTINGGDANG